MYAKSGEECNEPTEMREPCIVLNKDNEIILWYLPDCLVHERLVRIACLNNGLLCFILRAFKDQIFDSVRKARSSWLKPTKKGRCRNKEENLYRSLRNKIESGSVDLSPSWYAQGHEVRVSAMCKTFIS